MMDLCDYKAGGPSTFRRFAMNIENTHTDYTQTDFTVHLTDSMLYGRLHTLSAEYSLPVELLVNVAVKRLVNDVAFVRGLRTGKIGGA